MALVNLQEHTCTTCKISKSLLSFTKFKRSPTGLSYICKDCSKIKAAERNKNNKEQRSKTQKEYYYKNAEKIKESQREYYNLNKDKKIKQQIKYQSERRQTDSFYRVIYSVRRRLHHALRTQSWKKNSNFNEYIGCNRETLRHHIEIQFQLGMTWENYGHNTWHIDHIIPLASAKTEEELYKLCHYTNLQPLWAEDNFSKGAKCG